MQTEPSYIDWLKSKEGQACLAAINVRAFNEPLMREAFDAGRASIVADIERLKANAFLEGRADAKAHLHPSDESKCKCGQLGEEPHPCPCAADINDDSESLCNCCETCTQNCCDDI